MADGALPSDEDLRAAWSAGDGCGDEVDAIAFELKLKGLVSGLPWLGYSSPVCGQRSPSGEYTRILSSQVGF